MAALSIKALILFVHSKSHEPPLMVAGCILAVFGGRIGGVGLVPLAVRDNEVAKVWTWQQVPLRESCHFLATAWQI